MIQVGDLVMVVRGHVCDLGRIFTVSHIDYGNGGWECHKCGADVDCDDPFVYCAPRDGALFSWLKRIDPPAVEDERPTTKELFA